MTDAERFELIEEMIDFLVAQLPNGFEFFLTPEARDLLEGWAIHRRYDR